MSTLVDFLPEAPHLHNVSPSPEVFNNPSFPFSPEFFDSTISSHPDLNRLFFQPSKPVLANPIHTMCFEVIQLEQTGSEILDIEIALTKLMHADQQAKYAEFLKKAEEAASLEKERGWWGHLHQIITLILSTVAMVFGISMVANGVAVVAGGVMIASGVLMIVNYALEQTATYDKWAKELAQDLETQRRLAFIIPAAVGAIATVGSVIFAQMDFKEQIGTIVKTSFDLLKAG